MNWEGRVRQGKILLVIPLRMVGDSSGGEALRFWFQKERSEKDSINKFAFEQRLDGGDTSYANSARIISKLQKGILSILKEPVWTFNKSEEIKLERKWGAMLILNATMSTSACMREKFIGEF